MGIFRRSGIFWKIWAFFGYSGCFRLFWAILGYFGHFGLFFPFWAVLVDLGYFGRFGLFRLFWAILVIKDMLVVFGYFGHFGLVWSGLVWSGLVWSGKNGSIGLKQDGTQLSSPHVWSRLQKYSIERESTRGGRWGPYAYGWPESVEVREGKWHTQL